MKKERVVSISFNKNTVVLYVEIVLNLNCVKDIENGGLIMS